LAREIESLTTGGTAITILTNDKAAPAVSDLSPLPKLPANLNGDKGSDVIHFKPQPA
jgi:hypothetical protein